MWECHPKEVLLYKACNSAVELLVLHKSAKDVHGFKSSWMNEHLVDVVDQTLSLGGPVAWPGMAILIWNIIVAKVKCYVVCFLFVFF